MDKEEQKPFLDWLKNVDLKETASALEILSERLWQERLKNKGFTLYEVFNPSIGMGGNYTTIIAVPKVVAADGSLLGYAHKMREAGDDGYNDCYHQPGTLMRATQGDPFRDALVRLTGEFFGQDSSHNGKAVTELGFESETLPVSFVWEAFRKAFATRIAFFITIPQDVYEVQMKQGSGKDWELVQDPFTTALKVIPFELLWLQYAVKSPEPYKLIVPPEDVLP
jgi:hypothetical protein